jgi:hypothetical protein
MTATVLARAPCWEEEQAAWTRTRPRRTLLLASDGDEGEQVCNFR